jgi:starvation-inducible outer membrane lipoprotein
MIRLNGILFLFLTVICAAACTPLSPEVKEAAVPSVSYTTIIQNLDAYKGRTVILGGYTRGVKAVRDEVYITVVQAPLNGLDEPKSKTLSQGAFIVWHKGPLGAEAYEENRPVTVAGVVEGLAPEGLGRCPSPCLLLKSREIYIKPREIRDPMEAPLPPGSYGQQDMWDSPYPSTWYR